MKIVFVDTNILIDILIDRPPFSKYAIEIFKGAENGKVKLYTSSHSFATTHYVLKKYMDEKNLRELLFSVLNFVNPVSVDLNIIKRSLLSKHKDFEDAIQIFAANTIDNLDYIVTRDLKDFKDAGVQVLAPDDLLKYI
jgi:predicted nucleic acid-binding protein